MRWASSTCSTCSGLSPSHSAARRSDGGPCSTSVRRARATFERISSRSNHVRAFQSAWSARRLHEQPPSSVNRACTGRSRPHGQRDGCDTSIWTPLPDASSAAATSCSRNSCDASMEIRKHMRTFCPPNATTLCSGGPSHASPARTPHERPPGPRRGTPGEPGHRRASPASSDVSFQMGRATLESARPESPVEL
jgi:hypothetical protein